MHQDSGYRPAFEYSIGQRVECLLRANRTNERRGGVDIINAIKTGPEKAVGALIEFAGANVKNRRIGRRDGHGPDRQRIGAIENRRPVCAAIQRTPHATLGSAEIHLV